MSHININNNLRSEIARCNKFSAQALVWANEANTALERKEELAEAKEWADKAAFYEAFLIKRFKLGCV